jgi:hypothetical protein
MKHIRRIFALLLSMSMLLGFVSVARAVDDKLTVKANNSTFTEVNGQVTLLFEVKNPTAKSINISAVKPHRESMLSNAQLILDVDANGVNVPANSSRWVTVVGTVKGYVPEKLSEGLDLYYLSAGATKTVSVNDYKIDSQAGTNNGGNTSGGQTGESGDQTTPESTPDPEAKLRLSPVDANGLLVPAPEGDYGEAISVRIPLLCQRSSVYDLKITPVLSNDIEKFPFDIEAVDYMLTYPNSLQPGNIVEFTYNFRLSKKATTGVKQVDFNLSYRTGGDTWSGGANAGKLETATISIFVNVKKGLAPSAGDGEGAGSTPKLIVESYSISSDKIYAGETFDVTVTLRNTSSSEDIQNLQIGFKDTQEVAKLVPASGGSNTLYIKKIAKGDSVTEVISLQTAPDTEAKAYTLGLDFSYEGASDNKAYTAGETIAIPILQKIRVKFDDPTIYDSEAWVGQSCGMYVRMYNMGKSSLYNCMIEVEGEGLEMEETYFGGNISSGSTMSADFSVIPSVAGEIQGEVVITYEDVYGEPSEERLPFTLMVNEEVTFDDPMMGMEGMDGMEVYGPGMEESGGGMPWWGWVLCGLGVVALGVGGLMIYRKKRARHLEDV